MKGKISPYHVLDFHLSGQFCMSQDLSLYLCVCWCPINILIGWWQKKAKVIIPTQHQHLICHLRYPCYILGSCAICVSKLFSSSADFVQAILSIGRNEREQIRQK